MTSRKGQWLAFWELLEHIEAQSLQRHTLQAVNGKRERQAICQAGNTMV